MPNAAVAMKDARSQSSEVLVARQPIFDRDLKVFGYELLYRSGSRLEAQVENDDDATTDVITTAFIDIGLDRLVQEQPAFVNVGSDFILGGDVEALPADKMVFEILETAEVDNALCEAVAELVTKGYRFALDDFVRSPAWEPMLAHAEIVKLDFLETSPETLREEVARLKAAGIAVIAEKLESDDDYDLALELGCDYFQGFFFAKPRLVAGTRLQGNKLAILRLLAALHSPEAEVETVAELVGQDATLSYKLLRFINSASISIPQKVDSIQRAVVYLGLAMVKRMVTMTMVATVDDKPSELFQTALVRARLCERLCASAQNAEPGSAFTVGLFSALDAMMDRPLPELLEELPLSAEISDALLSGEGALGEALACAMAYEQGDWLGVQFGSLSPPEVGEAYADAVEWATRVASEL